MVAFWFHVFPCTLCLNLSCMLHIVCTTEFIYWIVSSNKFSLLTYLILFHWWFKQSEHGNTWNQKATITICYINFIKYFLLYIYCYIKSSYWKNTELTILACLLDIRQIFFPGFLESSLFWTSWFEWLSWRCSQQGADRVPLRAAGCGELGKGVWAGRHPRGLHKDHRHSSLARGDSQWKEPAG
jgi:hypothetical protein